MGSDVTAVVAAMTDAERPWVQEAIASILAQTRQPEAVVVMVESGNRWIEVDVARAQGEAAARLLRIERIPLARLGAVRNAGVHLASTRWVAFLDGDDVWCKTRLERQLSAAAKTPDARFVGADFVFIDAEGRPFCYSNGSTPTPSSWLVDRQLMLQAPFDPELTVGEDYFWLRATHQECVRIRVPEILVGYRIRSSSLSAIHHGKTRQRRQREALARASRFALLRYPILGFSYVRYALRRQHTYEV